MTNEAIIRKAVRVVSSSKDDLSMFMVASKYANLVGRELIRRGAKGEELFAFWERIERASF